MEAVRVVPHRHLNQCRLWHCRRFETPYCSAFHQQRSAEESEIDRAVVWVDRLEIYEELRLSFKVLNAQALGADSGIPTLPAWLLLEHPFNSPYELDLARLDEEETSRSLAFFSDTVKPANIWRRYDTRVVAGITRTRWHLRPQPAGCRFRLHRFTDPDLDRSLYWITCTWLAQPEPVQTEIVPPPSPDPSGGADKESEDVENLKVASVGVNGADKTGAKAGAGADDAVSGGAPKDVSALALIGKNVAVSGGAHTASEKDS